tara:strand:+ start:1598 stop:2725 length:1128 start_codon:yes stop_codon:yes gene_type:complete
MANNLTNVIEQLLARGLLALREQAITPQLVNREYETTPGTQGSTIDVPIPSAVTVADVAPGATPPSTADQTPGTVAIALDRWKEAAFHLNDKEMTEISERAGYLPMVASEAIRALANEVDTYVLGLTSKFFGNAGTAGTTPFASTVGALTGVRKELNNQLAPMDNRFLVMNPDAEANALGLRAFHDASFGVGAQAIMDGQITQRMGFNMVMNQNVQTHTAGTGSSYLVNNGSGLAVGAKTAAVDGGSGTVLTGDLIKFAGHDQSYVVTSATAGGTVTEINFEPGLVATVADNATVTITGTHVLNAAFHRDAIALVSKPLSGSSHPGSVFETAVDPVSGLALRLEVSREHKRDRFSYDILYGAEVIRRELGARMLG